MSARRGPLIALLAGFAAGCATARPPVSVETVAAAAALGVPPTPADSQALAKLARTSQSRFESLRRSRLPRTMGRGFRACDEIVGRFCLWYHDDDDEWTPPPEPDAVRAGRDQLLARFDTLAETVPGDPFITGQRVRYLVEAGRAEHALEAARACAAPGWWCTALAGFALHSAGRIPAADSAFSASLAAMPFEERCRWTDVTVLIDGETVRRDYERTSCAERAEVDRRFWWLADPLWMLPGNDRRTEHYARLVLERLQHRAASGYGSGWGEDLAELLLRYGWPAGWEREWGRPGTLGPGPIVSRHWPGARTFAPSPDALVDPTSVALEQWSLDPPRPREAHKAPYADAFDALEHQLARFPRGDSTVVVAAYDVGDSVPLTAQVDAALVISPAAREPLLVKRSSSRARAGVIVDTVPAGPTVVSVEALAPKARRAARARYGTAMPSLTPGALTLSDLLLFRPGDSLPATLEGAAPLALGVPRIASGERLGVYWEIAGALPGESVDVAVSLERQGKSWLRKAVEWIGLASDRSLHTRLTWGEELRGAAIRPRALAIDLPELERGVYRLTVAVTNEAGGNVATSRTLVVP